MIAWLRCFLRGTHSDPTRHPLGGFKCGDCGEAGADLEAMGFDAGYVNPLRRIYTRDAGGGSTARTSSWEPSARGW